MSSNSSNKVLPTPEGDLLENSKILIVDDQPRNIQVLGNQLRENNYKVEFVTSGDKALKWIQDEEFDLILLDILMPGMSGFEVCKQLKESPTTRDIPVIFLTAKTASEDILTGFEVGGVDYITKPFNTTELLARVRTHLELKRRREQVIQKNAGRKELLHILCHDLMNSLGPANSFLEYLKENPNEKEDVLDACITATRNGISIITLVRKFMALDENKLTLDLDKFSLLEIVRDSKEMIKQQFEKKGVELKLDIDPELHVSVERTSFINSVLNNLMTNAIKFSFSGGEIRLTTEVTKKQVKLIVRDFGIGIPEQLLNNIFEVDKPTTRLGTSGEEGTGFGMPLVRKFIESYGGEIIIRSQTENTEGFEQGTEVSILLNRA